MARFKAGSFLLAIEAQLPVVPLAVIGTRAVMPKGRLRTEPADVRLIVHDPIEPARAVLNFRGALSRHLSALRLQRQRLAGRADCCDRRL